MAMKGLLLMLVLVLAFMMGCGVPKAKYDELTEEKAALEAECESLTEAKAELEVSCAKLASDKEALQAERNRLVGERDGLRARVAELEERLRAAEAEVKTPTP